MAFIPGSSTLRKSSHGTSNTSVRVAAVTACGDGLPLGAPSGVPWSRTSSVSLPDVVFPRHSSCRHVTSPSAGRVVAPAGRPVARSPVGAILPGLHRQALLQSDVPEATLHDNIETPTIILF